jgi:hypothetical protein
MYGSGRLLKSSFLAAGPSQHHPQHHPQHQQLPPYRQRRRHSYAVIALLLALAALLASCTISGRPDTETTYTAQPAYLMAYFRSGPNQTDMTRKLHYAYSRDGLHWYELNHNDAVWSSPIGKGIIRDPFMNKAPDGNYYLVYTTAAPGNKSIGSARSQDLIAFTDAKLLKVMGNFPTVGNSWAPEWSWDEANKRYVIYWSSTVNSTNSGDSRIYKAYTTDWQTLTPAALMFDPGYNIIDANITSYNGKFYMLFKDGHVRPMRNRWAVSDTLGSGYGQISPLITPNTTEGPEVLKLTDQNKWYLYYDYWAAGKYGIMESTDLTNWSKELPTNTFRFPYQRRHASFFPISEEELDRLISHYSLLAQYPMDQDNGQTLKDATSNQQNGAVLGAKWSKSGHTGGALAFDGQAAAKLGDGKSRTSKDSLALPFALRTVSMWLKADAPGDKFTQVLYDEGSDTAGLAIRLKDGQLQAAAVNGNQRVTVPVPGTVDRAWHHVAVTFSDGELKIYIDGSEKASARAYFKAVPAHPGDNGIGRRFGADAFGDTAGQSDTEGFHGRIDDIAIYDIPLQAADIARLLHFSQTHFSKKQLDIHYFVTYGIYNVLKYKTFNKEWWCWPWLGR